MTREEIRLQTDPTVSSAHLRKIYALYDSIDSIDGLKGKMKHMKQNDPSTGKDGKHGTYIVNYTGELDWGELAEYIESYVFIVEGHLLLEISSMADKTFVSFMQLTDTDKYANAFKETLIELGVPSEMSEPFLKHLSKHLLPKGK